ncbi:MAG: alpha/beta hydrolase-fold protein [Candidatus Acidiferrum sp.]
MSRLAPCLALLLAIVSSVTTLSAEKSTATQLTAMAKSGSPALREAIVGSMDAKELKEGTAWLGRGPDFFFAIEASSEPTLTIDDAAGPAMERIADSNLWYASARIEAVGKLHSFQYLVGGKKFGGSLNLPAYGPLSYLEAGVPTGSLSPRMNHTSRIFDGMKSDYWIYVPAQYDAKTPAALMVFQDGEMYLDRENRVLVLNVIDNLIAQKKIPVLICVFINPGDISDSPDTPTYRFVKAYSEKWGRTLKDSMRSTLYDTVGDRYAKFLRDELLASVEAKYNIRKDGYSRAITGLSSGGICSFNAAWQMPEEFSRVISWIGSFSAIQWKEDPLNPDGGQDYPEKILREPKRNIRIWLEDGSNDLEIKYGSWALNNIRMANALKMTNYDFHFSFGSGSHHPGQGSVEFPEEMIWLWRDYDPKKSAETFQMDPGETDKPLFRVAVSNRKTD